jgi:ParB family transcriptional regulator, chromosome partitioning protein
MDSSEFRFERYLPIDKIELKLNVRTEDLEVGIEELAKSIKTIGVQQPIVVIDKKSHYELIIGQRRFRACKSLGLATIPAIVHERMSDVQATITSFSENIHRLDLNYNDKMRVATTLLNEFKTVSEVAKKLGVRDQTIRNYLGYSAVPELVKKMVDDGKLNPTTALRISRTVSDEKQAIEIASKVIETPRSANRRKILEIARENPTKTADEIVEIAKKIENKVSIDLPTTLAWGLRKASEKYQVSAEEIIYEALEEWLKEKGFLNE